MKNIYKLKLHESIAIKNDYINFIITRVASGWIYSQLNEKDDKRSDTFVPFDNEFMSDNNVR